MNHHNEIMGRVPSVMIAGPSNFPVRKKEKQNAARDRNMGEYMSIQGLLDKIKAVGTGGISADDDLAVEKLTVTEYGYSVLRQNNIRLSGQFRPVFSVSVSMLS